jgi:hypothetical protein
MLLDDLYAFLSLFQGNSMRKSKESLLWGYLKDIVYKNKHRSLSSLKQSIISTFATIGSDLSQKVCESVPERLQRCIDANGHQFEHLN